jgi:hypothetical protein
MLLLPETRADSIPPGAGYGGGMDEYDFNGAGTLSAVSEVFGCLSAATIIEKDRLS